MNQTIGPMGNVGGIRMPLLPGPGQIPPGQMGSLPGPSPDGQQTQMVQGPGGLSPFSTTTTTTSQFSANNGVGGKFGWL